MRKFLIVMMCIIMVVCFMPTVAMAEVPTENCQNGDSCTIHKAAIGTTHYDTLQEAVNDVTAGDTETTIKVLGDVTESVVIDKGKNIVLDLNGHTLTDNGNYAIKNSGTLYLKNGNIVQISNKNVLYVTGGVLKVENIAASNQSTGERLIYIGSNSTVEIISGTFTQYAEKNLLYASGKKDVTIKGGTFIQNSDCAMIQSYNSGTRVVVEGGTFTNNGNKQMLTATSGGKYSISGGTFDGGEAEILPNSMNCVVTGGKFSRPVYGANCVAGYEPTKETVDGYYGVKELTAETAAVVMTYTNEEEQTMTVYYADPAVALADAKGKTDSEVKIKGDVTTASNLYAYYAKMVVCEGATLNCKTISVSAGSASGLKLENNGTIYASSYIDGTTGSGTLLNNGIITCDFIATSKSENWINNGTITVSSKNGSTLSALTNNGAILGGVDGAIMKVPVSEVIGTGENFKVGVYKWSADENKWMSANSIEVIRNDEAVGGFDSIYNAVIYAQDGDIVRLLDDVTVTSQEIAKDITLDLNTHIVTCKPGASSRYGFTVPEGKTVTMQNGTVKMSTGYGVMNITGGTVTADNLVIDTSAAGGGSGKKSNTSGVNLQAGTFTLNSNSSIKSNEVGVYVRSQSVAHIYGKVETISAFSDASGAKGGFAAIQGNGTDQTAPGTTVNIYENAEVKSSGFGMAIYNPQVGTLNISGGTITGDTGIGIKSGNLNITGGTIQGMHSGVYKEPASQPSGISSDGSAILVDSYIGYAGSLNITVSGENTKLESAVGYAIREIGNVAGATNIVTMNLEDGLFSGKKGAVTVRDVTEENVSIYGGYFTSDPTSYVADGYITLPSDKSVYTYMVVEKTEAQTDAKPATGSPTVDDKSLSDTMTDDEKAKIADIAASVQGNGGELAAAANAAVGDVTSAQVSEAKDAYRQSEIDGASSTEDSLIYIYAQTYLNITPKEYKAEAEGVSATLKLDIEPMYRVVASREENAEDLKVAGETSDEPNAVVLEGSEKKLTNIQTMEVSVTLPDGFPTTGLKVKHTASSGVYYYIPTVTAVDGNNVATFTVTNGFSPFEFLVDARLATVIFPDTMKEYTVVNVGETLPTAAEQAGKVFGGWTFEGIDGTYTTLTDDLLTALAAKGETVTATPYFYTPSSNGYVPTAQKPEITTDSGAKTVLSSDGTKVTIKVADGYELVEVTVNGVSKGAVIELTGLKTGDKVVITTRAKETAQTLEEVKAEMAAINTDNFYARSKMVTLKSGKRAVKVTWYTTKDVKFDGVEIYRSTKRYSGYGKKPFFRTTKDAYYNTAIKKGTKYYYKVRGYILVDGQKVYTDYSTKAWRTVR